jgi:hypothetical protein
LRFKQGNQGKANHTGGSHDDAYKADTDAAERKKTTITANSFDHQVADKLGGFLDRLFLPTLKKFVDAGLWYGEVKRRLKIPAIWGWGARVNGEQFRKRASASLND